MPQVVPPDRLQADGSDVLGDSHRQISGKRRVLGQIDLVIPFLLRSGLLAALFALAWSGMRDLGFERRVLDWRDVPREAAAVASAEKRFRRNPGSPIGTATNRRPRTVYSG